MEVALEAGVRRFVIATTGWADDRETVERDLRDAGAAAVASANFSVGVALFLRLAETAAGLFGGVGGFDPFLVEWHRRAKADRPSGTALELARRMAEGRRNHRTGARSRDRVDPGRGVAGHAPGRLRRGR